jgi:predicted small lipoprotein YifL
VKIPAMRRILPITLIALFLAACGQTGALYLPKDDGSTSTGKPTTEKTTEAR